jgi:hypothetical protein
MKPKCWAVICPEPEEPGLWKTWMNARCVAIGWAPPSNRMDGQTDDDGWATARKRLRKVAPRDIVIPYLQRNRFGTPGKVVRVAVSDSDWQPTVEKRHYRGSPGEPGLGRRIYVEWLTSGTPPSGKVAQVPRGMRHPNGEVHQTIEPLSNERYARFIQIIKDQRNWKTYKSYTRQGATQTPSKSTPEKIRAGKRKNKQAPDAASLLTGNSLYIKRAREAFPILVRQALAREKIAYSDLADEMSMPNPRNLNYVLGAIGKAIQELSAEWGQKIPPLQCVVVNKNTGVPGEGIGWFISDLKDFKKRTPEEKEQIVRIELVKVFNYGKWPKVLGVFGLKPLANDPVLATLKAKARQGGGVGECEDHRRLKNYVANNPNVVGLSGFGKGDIEYAFPSADRIDVVFRNGDRWVGVEVKGPSSDDVDLVRGIFQTVKYVALREAELKSDYKKGSTEVILVVSRRLPAHLKELKNILGVNIIDGIVVPTQWDSKSEINLVSQTPTIL